MKKTPLWVGAPARRPPQDASKGAERPQRPRCTPPPRLKTKSLAFGVVNEGHEAGIGFLYTLYGEHILTET